ncbi:MAG: carboxypeptidase regulatory-like domain-containing protein [Ilumatobacter sp.]
MSTGAPFEITATLKNTTGVIDAFDLTVLGLDAGACQYVPERIVALFPNSDETVTIRVTLPDDYPAGESKLWVKASSQAAPAIDVLAHVPIYVEQNTRASIRMFPTTLVAGRTGRFGVTVANIGNGPMDVALEPGDGGNDFTYQVEPKAPQRIEAGDTTSYQVTLTGRRPITGAAVPKPFAIVPTASGAALTDGDDQPLELTGTFAPKPFVSTMVVAFAGFIGLMALWAVVVGAAINAIVDDTDADLANSVENGMQAVVDNLTADDDAAAAAAAGVLSANDADPAAAAGLSGEAVGVTVGAAVTGDDAPPMEVAPNEFAGTLTAASDGTPIPGGKVTAQALLDAEFTAGATPVRVADPNRPAIQAVADERGRFSIPDLLPGAYDVTISVPGFVEKVCSGVTIPASTSAPGCIAAGTAFTDGLAGETASVAGIVTVDGDPLIRTDDNQLTVTLSRLAPIEGAPEAATDTNSFAGSELRALGFRLAADFEPQVRSDAASLADGRFSFVLEPIANADACGADPALCVASTPGTFELVVEAAEYSVYRQLVQLEAGQKLIGIQVALVPPLPTALPAVERVLSGSVLDGAERPATPLAAATVTAVGPSATYTVSTGDDGTYTIAGVPIGDYSVTIEKDDYLSQTVQQTVARPTPGEDPPEPDPPVTLQPAPGTLSGTVNDADSRLGIAGVAVTLQGTDSVNASDPPQTATTDIDGRYSLRDLTPGTYSATFSPADGSLSRGANGTIVIDPNDDRVADVTLQRATGTRLLSGTVGDSRTGQPIPNVNITVTNETTSLTSTTDGSGYFSVDGLIGATSYTVTADGSAAGFSSATTTVRLGDDEQDRTLAIELVGPPPVRSVDLVVTDIVSGLAVSGAEISIRPTEATDSPTPASTVTDSNGYASIIGFAPDTQYEITVLPPEAHSGATRRILLGDDETALSLSVQRGPTCDFAGTVTPPTLIGDDRSVTVTAAGPNGIFTTGTDGNGTYSLAGLPAGVYSVTFSKPPLTERVRTIAVCNDSTIDVALS